MSDTMLMVLSTGMNQSCELLLFNLEDWIPVNEIATWSHKLLMAIRDTPPWPARSICQLPQHIFT